MTGQPSIAGLERYFCSGVPRTSGEKQKSRHNSIRTRNARIAAIRAFMRYAGTKEPTAQDIAQSVLAIPLKRFGRRLVGFLSRKQIQAILDAPASCF